MWGRRGTQAVTITSVTEVIEVIGYQLWRGVLWRPSRHGVRSGQGRFRVLEMYLKSGCVCVCAQLGHDLSMGMLLEKLGPALYSPYCVEGGSAKLNFRFTEFSEVACPIAPAEAAALRPRLYAS